MPWPPPVEKDPNDVQRHQRHLRYLGHPSDFQLESRAGALAFAPLPPSINRKASSGQAVTEVLRNFLRTESGKESSG